VTNEEERELRIKVMQADLLLKQRQAFWETPRNLALIIAAAVGIAGVVGFKLGQREPAATQIVLPAGAMIMVPATKP
jgi:hypothetical protein